MSVNFSYTNPAAPSKAVNVHFQGDPTAHDISAYLDLMDCFLGGENAQVGTSYTLVTGDFRKLVTSNNGAAVAFTLPQAITPNFAAKWYCFVMNLGGGTVTITPTTSTIDGQSSVALAQYQGILLISNGTDWRSIRGVSTGGGGGGAATWGSITGTLSTQADLQSALDAKLDDSQLDTDGTLAANSDAKIASQKATKTYVDALSTSVTSSLAAKAPLASPTFTGDPKAPTATAGDNDTSVATTAFVQTAIASKADLASPTLTGDPKAPTPTAGDNDTSIATTAFVTTANAAKVAGPGSAVDSDFAQFDGTTGKLIKDGGLSLDTNVALGTSDAKIPSQKAVKSYVDGFAPGGGGALTLKTNGVTNGSQALLDLIQGLGITVADDGTGHITITGPFAYGGDGSDGSITFDGSATVLGLVPSSSSGLTLTSVAAGTGVYQGTITGGANNAFAGLTFVVTGFSTGANNGTFVCAFSTSSAITLVNYNSVAETHAGTATPSQTVYIMTRDIFAINVTINANVFVKTANFRLVGTGTLTVNGTLSNAGGAGGAGASVGNSQTGGAAGATGQCTTSPTSISGSMGIVYPGGQGTGNPSAGAGGGGGTTTGTQGTQGGNMNAGTNPVLPGGSAGSSGASGGQGGTGTSGAGGATRTGGTGPSAPTAIGNTARAPWPFFPAFITPTGAAAVFSAQSSQHGGASGGSGGGGDTTNAGAGAGGGGGNGGYGGWMYVAFPTIVVGASGIITVNGGDGAPGGNGGTRTTGNVGGGGGGAGGTGGMGGAALIVYHKLTNNGTISANGGASGAAGAKGSPHGTGTDNAAAGGLGTAGQPGCVISVAV